MQMRQLDAGAYVAGQISPEEVAEAAAAGVTTIVNNRPDGEQPGQPTSDEIAAAAQAAGLGYHHIPVSGGFSADQVDAMAQALEGGTALIYCASGTRSTYLWALARAARGADGEGLIAAAGEAGYNIAQLRPYLG